MSKYHDPLDIMPFPNEEKAIDKRVLSSQSRKESFIDHLLKQYVNDRSDKVEVEVNADVYGKIKRDIERLEHAVSSLEKKIADSHYSDQRELKTDVTDMRDRFEQLHAELAKRVEAYMLKVEGLLSSNAVIPAVQDADTRVDERGKSRVELLKYYEFENIKLKQLNMRLMRVDYEKRIERYDLNSNEKTTEVASLSIAKNDKETQRLIEDIQKLEAKKTQLIKDNIQLNEFSHEIVEENERLKNELSKYGTQQQSK